MRPWRCVFHRHYSTTLPFIPPPPLRDLGSRNGGFPGRGKGRGRGRGRHPKNGRFDDDEREFRKDDERLKSKPASPSFYTARPLYYDQVLQLESAIQHSRSALKTLQLLPLPAFARASLPPLVSVWKDKEEMSELFKSRMTTSRYRQVTTLLGELNDHLRIATTAGCVELAHGIEQIVNMFESGNKDDFLNRGRRKKVALDQYGRSYTYGKRKTSTARVWMIPVQPQLPPQPQPQLQSGTTLQPVSEQSLEEIFGIEPSQSALPLKRSNVAVTPTTILVNNLSLAEYFPLPADRERIVRPLKIAGVLGAYHIFCIVRGGGTTGQSGALAHGISKGLLAHEPGLEALLRRAKLLRRDPRMVERKKTGLAKSRKRYTWVKR